MRLAAVLFLAGILRPMAGAEQSGCREISLVDFRNRVIVARRETRPLFYGLFNGPAPGGPIRLRDGRSYDWDLTPGDSGRKPPPDWLTEIDRDVVVRPPRSGAVRVLSLTRTHLTGTGSFTYIFGFTCQEGVVRKIFEASGQGIKLGTATDSVMVVDVAVWVEGDAHA